jgi:hypothetical protein
MSERRLVTLFTAFFVVALYVPVLAAQEEEEETADQSVARVAFLQGKATYNRGDDPDNWQPAPLNFPLTTGDRFWTARDSRTELQTAAGLVLLAPETDLSVLNLTDDVSQLSMGAGTASFRIRHLAADDSFEVAAPNAAVTFKRAGYYRIDVDASGNTRVSVFRGAASVAAAGGLVRLEAGDAIHVEGIDAPQYDVTDVPRPDSWDRWVESRASRFRQARPLPQEAAGPAGLEDLEEYGRWEEIPSYGRVWTPAAVEVGWAPYRDGSWVWRDPWGWTWVSAEPWGWAPYHYGRWVLWSSRWYWVPDPPSVRVRWAPAYVGFVGGGPGWSVSVGVGGGYVGWFPLAPREPFVPWWGRRRADVNVHVTNVTYVNRTHVTVVNQNTFVSGAPVARHVVRDREVVQRVSTAPVTRGPLPVAPSRASLHVASPAASPVVAAPPRPPAPVLSRSVVSRMPQPPAPKPFRDLHETDSPPPAVGAPRPPARTEARRAQPIQPVEPVRPAPAPEAKAPPPARPSPIPETRRAQPARPVPVPESKAAQPARPAETRQAERPPAPATRVRPAQAEKVQLEPRGQAQRRRVEPLKTEQPPRNKEKEKEKPAAKKPEGGRER